MDLRLAFNSLSDVILNRPPPLREFDQIYMKVGDMVIQSDFVARKYDNKNVVFIGDGDSISLSTVHLQKKEVFPYGPRKVTVLDFDERIVNSINNFADHHELADTISAQLYNVIDPLPSELVNQVDAFYTNPPWGASNQGSSVISFIQRGIEATNNNGTGMIIIADDSTVTWTQEVLGNVQAFALKSGFTISEMIPNLHSYHLDDNPELKSCTLVINKIKDIGSTASEPMSELDKINFYGRDNPMRVHYIREMVNVAPGTAHPDTYKVEEI